MTIDFTAMRFMPARDLLAHFLKSLQMGLRIPITKIMIRYHPEASFQQLS